MNLTKRLKIVALVTVLTVGIDQWTKQLAISHLEGQPDHYFLNDIFRLTFAKNTGAFLSLGSELGPYLRPLLLNFLPGVLLIGLLVYIFRERKLNPWQAVSLSLIVGGGLSNIVDRLLYGYVVDMLHMKVGSLQTGIFNVADMAIMAGMFMMIPYAFQKEPKDDKPVLDSTEN